MILSTMILSIKFFLLFLKSISFLIIILQIILLVAARPPYALCAFLWLNSFRLRVSMLLDFYLEMYCWLSICAGCTAV